MKKPRLARKLVFFNLQSIFLFELVVKTVVFFVFVPVIRGGFRWLVRWRGFRYITTSNFLDFALHPVVLLALLLTVLLAALTTLFETCGLLYVFHGSYYKERISLAEILLSAGKTAKKMVGKNNRLIIVFMLVLLPITEVILVTNSLFQVRLPAFVLQYINDTPGLSTLYNLLMLIAFITVVRWMYSIHGFALENKTFRQARKESRQLLKGHMVRDIVSLFLWEFLLMIGFALLFVLFLGSSLFFVALMDAYPAALILVLSVLVTLLNLLVNGVVVPLAVAYLSALYYQALERKGREVPPLERHAYPPVLSKYLPRKRVVALGTLIFFVANTLTLQTTVEADNAMLTLGYLPEVVAHRGDSVRAPENTYAAFESAIQQGSDWIELDVAQLGDGTLVVMHDSNFQRIAGERVNVWDATYEQVKDWDIGSWFDDDFDGVTISTLEDVLVQVKGRCKLNIELKPTGHEVNLEEEVVRLIEKHHFTNHCVISSFNYQSLEEIKRLNPFIKTAYVMALGFGRTDELYAADSFSVEYSVLSASFVRDIHSQGKKVHVWTVNDKDNIQAMMDYRVDYLITDDPAMARKLVDSQSQQTPIQTYMIYLSELVDMLFGGRRLSLRV